MSNFRLSRLVAGAAVIVVAAACADEGPTAAGPDVSPVSAAAFIPSTDGSLGTFGTAGVPDTEFFEVCKRWEGTPGVATFDVFDGTTTSTISTNEGTWVTGVSGGGFNDWSCRNVQIEGGTGKVVRVTETDPGAGYALTAVSALALSDVDASVPVSPATVGSNYVEGLLAGYVATPGDGGAGITAYFTNTELPPPPGGEGCTPGYWRQPQHFGNWTGYAPTDDFDTVFGVSYGGTLLQAVWARGGQENALARHAVAALLNAANTDVDYDLTEAEVIALVQAAFASGDYESAKNTLAAYNEQGCDLGRAELEDTSTGSDNGKKGNRGR